MPTINNVSTAICNGVTSITYDLVRKSDLEKIDVSEDDMLRIYKLSYYVSINNSESVFAALGIYVETEKPTAKLNSFWTMLLLMMLLVTWGNII